MMLMNTESKRPRYLFLDNIKVLFTIIVISWHVIVTYAGVGWWYYQETNTVDPISYTIFLIIVSFGGIFQTSLLGLFFLLGGYFTPKSYDRKGGRSFWKERLIRIGIPLLLYIVLINPVIIYILSQLGIPPWSSNPLLQGSLLDYYLRIFLSSGDFIDFLTFAGPMWFLLVLLLFTAVYTFWRQLTKFDWVQRKIPKEFSIPRYWHLLLFAIGLGCLTFLVRTIFSIDNRPLGIPWAQLIQYLMMFSVGVICIRYHWFDKMTKKQVQLWVITILTAIVLMFLDIALGMGMNPDFNLFSGGANLHAFLFAVVDTVICMGMIFVMIKVFYAKFNKQGTILRNLSDSAYHMYIVHPPILIALSVVLASVALYPLLKVAVVIPAAVLLCYLVSHYVLQRTLWKKHTRAPQNS
jgi:glucan biosynthesis protein C